MPPDPQIAALIAAEGLPEDYHVLVAQWWAPLAEAIALRVASAKDGQALVVGINGAQGSGKSTLAAFLAVLLRERGLRVGLLALDDLYLTRQQRAAVAANTHPLFATRGVPGTHDTALGAALIDHLRAGGSVEAPQFDKAADDRLPQPRIVAGPVDVVLFEGWCVGAAPMADDDLSTPINALEATEDPQAIWRKAINTHLAQDYAALFARIDMLIMLAVPDFASVRQLRGRQEAQLAASRPDGPAVMNGAALDRFISHYERLTRAMLAEMSSRADVLVELDGAGQPVAMRMGFVR